MLSGDMHSYIARHTYAPCQSPGHKSQGINSTCIVATLYGKLQNKIQRDQTPASYIAIIPSL